MTWHVVKFTKENCVEAVPRSWYIKASSECFWPPSSCKREKIFRHIENCSDPLTDWKLYPITLLGTYDDFNMAQHKAKKATVTSDLSSGGEALLGNGRKRRRNPKYNSSSDSDVISSESSDNNAYPQFKKTIFSATSTLKKSARSEETKNSKFICSQSRSYSPTPKSRTLSAIMEKPLSDDCEDNTQRNTISQGDNFIVGNTESLETQSADVQLLDETLFTPSRNQISQRQHAKNSETLQNHSYSCSEVTTLRGDRETKINMLRDKGTLPISDNDFKRLVVDDLSHLHLKINALMDNVTTLIKVQRNEANHTSMHYENYVHILNQKLPVQSNIELDELEQWLLEDDNYKLMVKEFRRVGGHSYSQATRKLLYRGLSNAVAIGYSWDGAKQKQKFKNLRLAKGILDSMKIQYSEVSENDIVSVIKIWLVKAKDRMKRAEKP